MLKFKKYPNLIGCFKENLTQQNCIALVTLPGPSLEKLVLSDNLIETVERRALQDLPALKEIHLDQNLIEHLSSDAIAGTPSIR